MAPALTVLASGGGNGVATIARLVQTSPELSLVSLRALAKKALHRGSIQYRRHNACVASWAKMVVTGLARR
jgi:hypothetical protein